MTALVQRVGFRLAVILSLVVWFYLGVVYFSLPSEQDIQNTCFRTKMFGVELCEKRKNYVRLGAVPKHFINLLLLAEDASFWSHQGFDWEEIKNSFVTNWEKGYFARGGSTITQQLARNLFLNRQKNLHRKLLEAIITMRLEALLTKKQILERYINVVQFGQNVFGISQASNYYFKKSPNLLRPEESAFLVMLLPNPERNAKSFYQKKLTRFAEGRIKTLLRKLWITQGISDEEYQASLVRLPSIFEGHDQVE